jgi:poly-D-alanine transfer protein DltD
MESQDEEQSLLQSDPICSSAGCTQYKFPKAKAPEEPDYSTLPNFGADPEVTDTSNSIAIAERQYKHKWNFGNKESLKKYHNVAKDVLYDEAPELDQDIVDSQQNL